MKKQIKDKGSKVIDPKVARLTLYPFGRLAFRLNMDAKERMVNLDDIRTFKKSKKDLEIGIKLPNDRIEHFYLARSKLAKVEYLELEVVEA